MPANMEEHTTAMTNRSLRTIRTELEYLTDASILSPAQLSTILNLLPAQTPLHVPVHSTAPTTTTSPSPNHLAGITSQFKNSFLSPQQPQNEKKGDSYYSPQQQQQPTPIIPAPTPIAPIAAIPPPAYSHTPKPIASASALYEYLPSDAGDLAIAPNDRISILEFMNADWAKGRNERTGAEGIFPRSYVQIVDEKSAMVMPPQQQTSGYGNVPMDVSQSGTGAAASGSGGGESKFNQQGKKFGKKMGNAAIFGAGATIGSNIVNGIF
ncbi:MAG: hypothetical protein L6R37_002203 [Teloschistes peruensis]|nr:MAG: hypothetical protein L6R37_002203 [Teloschistes peruensis]